MNFYSITYDLVRIRDYKKIRDGIILLCNNIWVRPTESQWIIATNKTSTQVRDFLTSYLDHDDVLFVAKVDMTNLAWQNMPTEVANWMRRV